MSRPCIELHLHLEGAAPPELTRRVAMAQGVSTDGLFDAEGRYAWTDFTAFLRAYDAVAGLFRTPEAVAELAREALLESAAHGVVYTEIFLSPDHAGGTPAAWNEHLAAVREGAAKAEAETGIVARWIPLAVRNFGPGRARRAAELAAATAGDDVVAFGLAGDERVWQPADFRPAFDVAREAGLKLTAHAGEFGGAESVRRAWADLALDRIDHGVRAVDDPALVARLAEAGVHLTACPGSNLALGVYPDMAAHPFDRLRRAGVSISFSTDDPPFFGTDMTREHELLAGAFGYGEADFAAIAREALAAAFCDEATRERVAARLG